MTPRATPSFPVETSYRLIRLWNTGLSQKLVAERLGVSESAVSAHVRRLRKQGFDLELRQPGRIKHWSLSSHAPYRKKVVETKPKRCLNCRRIFASTWNGNRRCRRCLDIAKDHEGYSFA